jgi:Ras-related protein Rab-28
MKSTDSDDDDVELKQYKVILLGDGAVGKTSIANRFTDGNFSQNYKQTVGVDFFIRKLQLSPKVNCALQIWDIGGQSIGSKMITNYIAGAHAILLCYDITNYESFANLEDWYRIVVKTFTGQAMPYVALVGNKNDLKHMAAVRMDIHNSFATENSMNSFLMSAKSGDQVLYAFQRIACTLAGLPFVRSEAMVTVVAAQIIDYERNDPNINNGELRSEKKERGCIMS